MRIPVNLRFISQITRRQERQMVLADRIHLANRADLVQRTNSGTPCISFARCSRSSSVMGNKPINFSIRRKTSSRGIPG